MAILSLFPFKQANTSSIQQCYDYKIENISNNTIHLTQIEPTLTHLIAMKCLNHHINEAICGENWTFWCIKR